MSSVDDENSSTSTSSSSVTVQKPIFLRASMLRPSAFSAQLFSASPATNALEKDSATATVAEQVAEEDEVVPVDKELADVVETEKKPPAENDKPVDVAAASDPLALLTKSNGLAKSNPFTAVQVTPLASSSAFVFGQNTRDRVTGNNNVDSHNDGDEAAGSNGNLSFSTTAGPKSSGTDGEEASDAEKSAADKEKGDASGGRSLSDVAREYEENKNARKRKFEEVETFTGEEDENNVLDVTCKLYTFAQVYEERGRGSLRLNDPKKGTESAPRLVFRTAGSLRVLLNTKIWDGMIAEPASPKSLRLTAIDTTGQVKVYLVMARPSDIQSLAMALKTRITAAKAANITDGVEKVSTNGSWDGDEEEGEQEQAKSKVKPDLIADTEKNKSAEGDVDEVEEDEDEDTEELESLIVEVPALKRRALDTKEEAPVVVATDDSKPMDVHVSDATAAAAESTPAAQEQEPTPKESEMVD